MVLMEHQGIKQYYWCYMVSMEHQVQSGLSGANGFNGDIRNKQYY
jgi:hypothetical protein